MGKQIESLNKNLSDRNSEIEKYKSDQNKNQIEEKEKSKQIQSLKQKLLDKDKELEKYKNDQNESEEKKNIINNNNQLQSVENYLRLIQESIAVKAQIDADAIETAQDTIKNAHIQTELKNETQFSSLGYNIYEMKKQINNIVNLLQTESKQTQQTQESEYIKHELQPLIVDTLKSSLIQYNLEKDQNNDDEDDEDDDVQSIKSEESSSSQKHLILKQQIDNEMKEALQSNILQIVNQSKQEIIEYI